MSRFLIKICTATLYLSFSASSALAANVCNASIGSTVKLTEINKIIEATSGLTKDEFETTEQFEERVRSRFSSLFPEPIILQTAYDQGSAFYYADRSSWFFTEYFASNSSWIFDEEAIKESGLQDAGPYASIILNAQDDVVGTYTAQNGLGAKAEIAQVDAKRIGVLEIARGAPISSTPWKVKLFDLPGTVTYTIKELSTETTSDALPLPMPPKEARMMKGKFKFAVQVEPVEPYVLTTEQYISPRIDMPREATVHSTFIASDIQCGIVTDQDNKVLAVMSMAKPF